MRTDEPIHGWPSWRRAGERIYKRKPLVQEGLSQAEREALSAELALKYPPPDQPAELITRYIEIPDPTD